MRHWTPIAAAAFSMLGLLVPAAGTPAPQTASAQRAGTQSAPAGGAAELMAAREAYDRGDCAAALPGLEAASVARPGDALLHYQVGFCLARAGQADRAKDHKQRAVELFEREAAAGRSWEPFYYLAALAALDLGDTEHARVQAEKGLSLLPPPGSLDGVGCFKASRMAGFAGKAEDAALWMRRAAERFASEPSPPPVYAADALLTAGEAAFEAGENARARDWLERAAKLSDHARGAWYLAGAARLRLKDAAGALEALRHLDQEPERTETQYAVRLLERIPRLDDLPGSLPDGRKVGDLAAADFGAALRSACGGEWKEASRPSALALLAELLRRGQTLRETALAGGCIDLLFR